MTHNPIEYFKFFSKTQLLGDVLINMNWEILKFKCVPMKKINSLVPRQFFIFYSILEQKNFITINQRRYMEKKMFYQGRNYIRETNVCVRIFRVEYFLRSGLFPLRGPDLLIS